MSYEDIPAPPNIDNFRADHITVYGVKLNEYEDEPLLPLSSLSKLWLAIKVVDDKGTKDKEFITIAVAYGYAFEGHCYRMDRPKLLVFEHEDDKPASGCGFGGDYRMWRIRSKTELLEIALSFDLAEKLILEANLPGNRAPNTYGNNMQLAHRSGRIGKSGAGS
ncbi:hypothetical protein [Mesorhizobium sp. WSM2239]|uniref:Uncharacterized protein n=2 Tax=unclassified Mesorhizobium TaxID=325217 RepID=A0AAU8DJL5_9HYPH